MFRNSFSFSGRIRRLEYGLSFLVFIPLNSLLVYLYSEVERFEVFFFLAFTVLYWFLFAQGAKRCHDLSNNGFYQFIPLYGLWMIFEEGSKNENKFGGNPKTIIKTNKFEYLPDNKTFLHFISEILTWGLLTVLCYIIITFKSQDSGLELLFIYFSLILPNYFFFLSLTNKGKALCNNKDYHSKQRITYAVICFLVLRIYSLYYRESNFDGGTIPFEIILIFIIYGTTYFPYKLYLLQKTVIVYHPRRNKVNHSSRVKVNHVRRRKVNH